MKPIMTPARQKLNKERRLLEKNMVIMNKLSKIESIRYHNRKQVEIAKKEQSLIEKEKNRKMGIKRISKPILPSEHPLQFMRKNAYHTNSTKNGFVSKQSIPSLLVRSHTIKNMKDFGGGVDEEESSFSSELNNSSEYSTDELKNHIESMKSQAFTQSDNPANNLRLTDEKRIAF